MNDLLIHEPRIAWIVEVNSEGNIESVSSPGATIPEEGSINEANGFEIRHILSSELEPLRFSSAAQFLTENSWNGSNWVDRGPKPGTWYIWDNGWVPAQEAIELEVRRERTEKLFWSDWTQGPDAPLTDEKKAEWRTYRQALRDVMSNLPEDLDDPAEVVWPTEPT